MIYLDLNLTFRYDKSNGDHFLVIEDRNSGREDDRFDVLVWRAGKTAKFIGRELPLAEAKAIVEAYPRKVRR